MHRLIFVLAVFLLNSVVNAQTVAWQILPSNYSSIEKIDKDLFKVVRNGKVGLITSSGNVIAEPMHDQLSDFYDNKAIMTLADGHGERVVGCLTDDGKYYSYADKYYALSGQNFFSEGLLPVSNEAGKVGYIDMYGNAVLGFDGKYVKITPFVEGHAVVRSKQGFRLIDKDGKQATFHFNGVGEVLGCTNSYNGKVCVWDTKGNPYFYNINEPNAALIKASGVDVKQGIKNIDYLFRFSSISGLGKEVPFVKKQYSGIHGLAPTKYNGRYGFFSEDKVILPYQLSTAQPFVDNLSVVAIDGLLGILRYVEGENFSVSCPPQEYDFYIGKHVWCIFTLTIPSVWRERGLNIYVKDSDGISFETMNTNNTFTFSVIPTAAGTKVYRVEVYAEKLKLYEGDLTYKFERLCEECNKKYSLCNGNHRAEPVNKDAVVLCPFPGCGLPVDKCPKRGKH